MNTKNAPNHLCLFEDFLQNRPDLEGAMIHSQLKAVSEYTQKISDIIKPEDQLPAWIQSKITLVKDYLDEVYHTIDSMSQQETGQASFDANQEQSQLTDSGDFLDFDKFSNTEDEEEEETSLEDFDFEEDENEDEDEDEDKEDE